MPESKIIKVPKPFNRIYYWIGLVFLLLNKIRHSIRGYTSPRTFPITEFERAIEYDFRVFNHWMEILEEYLGSEPTLKGKTILELGPGADLGIGLITLMNGAKYNAIDVNNLVETVPEQFYEELFKYLETIKDKEVDIDYLRSQLKLTQAGENDTLNYVVRKDFDITALNEEDIDLVVSQAAFEHFDNVEHTISQLSKVVKSGTILIAEVDLETHTRWIRDLDPLNIYRYSDFIYGQFKFPGSPNRIRPFEYKEILEKYGWSKIKIMPLTKLEGGYLKVNKSLNKRFHDKINQMDFLSIMICATKR